MKLKRRNLLLLLAGGTGVVALVTLSMQRKKISLPSISTTAQKTTQPEQFFSFQSIKGPIPLETFNIPLEQQIEQYNKYEEVFDDLLLPEDFKYEVIVAWGDKLSDARFRYSNPCVSFVATEKDPEYLLEDERYLQASKPAAAVFRKQQGQGYIDGLGDRTLGSFANCAGRTTPWGMVLSAEENFQNQVPEAVYADRTAFDPSKLAFAFDKGELQGQGNVFGLARNKYGWIIEVEPANPNDCGTKHTWLGRYWHEAVGVRVEAGKQLAFYSRCDRGGHVYKFISRDRVKAPHCKTNGLLQNGMLYAAKFNLDSIGRWIPLQADTPINPNSLNQSAGNLLRLLKGRQSTAKGDFAIKTNAQMQQFKQQYKQLGDLYLDNEEEKQGAILINARYAASTVGTTATVRPEGTQIAPNGSLYMSFISGADGEEGEPDNRIFKIPKGETACEYGWSVQLLEDENEPAALSFRWQMLAIEGEPARGAGFANPDNLLIDRGDLSAVAIQRSQ